MTSRRPPSTSPESSLPTVASCERGLLGCILINPSVLALCGPKVSAGDFLDDGLGSMYGALVVLSDAGKLFPDNRWLHRELFRLGVPEDLCVEMNLRDLVEGAVHEGHVVFYADEVAKAAVVRRHQVNAAEYSSRAKQPNADPKELRQFLEARLASLDSTQPHDMRLIADIAADSLAAVDVATDAPTGPGLMTGIERLDASAGAVMPGEVVIIAARTGCGKTSLATQIAEHNAERYRPVLMVSLEMRGTELALRMLCGRAEVDSRDLRSSRINDQARHRLEHAKGHLDGLQLLVWAPSSATMPEIRGAARYAKATAGVQLVVVDYIGLVKPTADEKRLQRYEQVSAVSAGLKSLAKELDVVVLALAQLNREADGAEPKLSHLRESGSIEQDADAVWLIHHPPVTGPAASEAVSARTCHLIVAKHRHGDTGRVHVLWHPSVTRFSSPESL